MRLRGTMLSTRVHAEKQGPSITTRWPDWRTDSKKSTNEPAMPPGLPSIRRSANAGVKETRTKRTPQRTRRIGLLHEPRPEFFVQMRQIRDKPATSFGSGDRRAAAPARPSRHRYPLRRKRLIEVPVQIVGRLQPDRQTNDIIPGARRSSLLVGQLAMGGRGRVQDQAARVADVGEMREQPHVLDQPDAGVIPAPDAEREHGASPFRQIFLREVIIGALPEAGVGHPRDLRV